MATIETSRVIRLSRERINEEDDAVIGDLDFMEFSGVRGHRVTTANTVNPTD